MHVASWPCVAMRARIVATALGVAGLTLVTDAGVRAMQVDEPPPVALAAARAEGVHRFFRGETARVRVAERPPASDTGVSTQSSASTVGTAPAVAVWFTRAGAPIVVDAPEPVVRGVHAEQLARGIGWYPHSAEPGAAGNVALAGHRTTSGAPLRHLDALAPGDRIHLADRRGRVWSYRVVEQRVVASDDVWVVGSDPLGTGRPMVTLTTCHPLFSAARRLVVWGEQIGVRPGVLPREDPTPPVGSVP